MICDLIDYEKYVSIENEASMNIKKIVRIATAPIWIPLFIFLRGPPVTTLPWVPSKRCPLAIIIAITRFIRYDEILIGFFIELQYVFQRAPGRDKTPFVQLAS